MLQLKLINLSRYLLICVLWLQQYSCSNLTIILILAPTTFRFDAFFSIVLFGMIYAVYSYDRLDNVLQG